MKTPEGRTTRLSGGGTIGAAGIPVPLPLLRRELTKGVGAAPARLGLEEGELSAIVLETGAGWV